MGSRLRLQGYGAAGKVLGSKKAGVRFQDTDYNGHGA